MQKRIHQALVFHLLLSLPLTQGLYAEERRPNQQWGASDIMISTQTIAATPATSETKANEKETVAWRPSLSARLYSSFIAANSFFYYLFYPFAPTYTTSNSKNHTEEVKVIDVQNFMNGGTYPSTPTNPMWFTTTNGNVPTNAAVYRTVNDVTTYHCRAYYQDDYQDGELVPGQGCYVKQGKTILRFTMYDVLLNPYSQ